MKYIDDIEQLKPTITIGTHFFKINNAQGKIAESASKYAGQFNHMGLSREMGPNGRPKMEVKARFYTFIPLKNEFRFHIEQLNGLLDYFECSYIGPTDIDIVSKEYTKAPECTIKIKEGWILRDYQEAVKKFLLDTTISPSKSRLASLPTGTGKTVIGLSAAVALNCKIAIPVPAGYSDKWVGDVLEQLEVKPEEIMMIGSGSKPEGAEYKKVSVRKAIEIAKQEDCPYKVFVLSQETLASYYKEYEKSYFEGFEEHWGCHPEDLFETLGVGVAIIDETHEAINMVFRMMTYMNLPLVIGLSGTLRSREDFVIGIQKLMFPSEVRYDKVKMQKYIHFLPTSYQFANLHKNKIKISFGGNMYSQAAYEQSLYNNKNKLIFKNLLKMFDKYFKEDYLDRRKPGEKCAIYVSRVELCEILVKYLKFKYPTIDIRKYTSADPFENAIDSEVRVTTRGSCGTAIDIKKLVSIITFDNVDSDVGNLQLLGRLRENKETDTIPYFRQLYCASIPKHVGYQKTRHQLFSDRVANITYSRHNQPLDIEEGASLNDYI